MYTKTGPLVSFARFHAELLLRRLPFMLLFVPGTTTAALRVVDSKVPIISM
ncbi:Uncharacterised protein [Mycobacteroides abscessus subsp. abscessus]|nr:Uncharacterised protein [Mycobacteroides abscessus subsp. abscessus]